MQAKAFNPQVFLEFLCYSLFGGLMFYLVGSGKYLSYVTPRMKPYLYFTAVAMMIWALAGLRRLFRPQHIIRSAHCFVLVIPILSLLLPHSPLATSDLSARYIRGNALTGVIGRNPSASPKKQIPPQSSQAGTSANTTTDYPSEGITDITGGPDSSAGAGLSSTGTTPPGDNRSDSIGTTVPDKDSGSAGSAVPEKQPDKLQGEESGPAETAIPDTKPGKVQESVPGPGNAEAPGTKPALSGEEFAAALPGLDKKNKKITVGNEYFYQWICELYSNMEKYSGYRISMTGFVFKDHVTMADNEFVPARLTMTCCIADLTPFGLVCQYDGVSELKPESWVTVEGVLHIGKSMQNEEPQITVTKIKPAEEVEGYVYPF